MIISKTPKMLFENTSFLKNKAYFPVKKKFWPLFSRIIEHEKRQATYYKGTQGFLTSIVQAMWSFL